MNNIYNETLDSNFNLKQFMKDHKKEIFMSGVSIFSTVLFYHYCGVKINKDVFNFTFTNDYNYDKSSFGNVNICLKGCKIKDLGKFGQKVIESFPTLLSKNDTIDSVRLNFKILRDFKG